MGWKGTEPLRNREPLQVVVRGAGPQQVVVVVRSMVAARGLHNVQPSSFPAPR